VEPGVSLRGERDGAGGGTFRPQLTSLVDVMTILLVFLIKSFSVEGNLVTPSSDLELPFSTSKKPPKPTCGLEITRNAVVAEGNVLATLESFSDAESLVVPVLFDWMRIQRQKCLDTANAEVMIQADRAVEFNVVKRVMYTCSKAGFRDFSVLVFEKE
jgi:biopolymer transport protein ExbD